MRAPPTGILIHNNNLCKLFRHKKKIHVDDKKLKYEPTFFKAKNKNEDSDLGWTADLKINLDKL